jgi:membrane peptidoglycan carboxypeptidase
MAAWWNGQAPGYTSLTREDYGLALTLGGGDVSLLEMAGAYAVFANNGVRVPPVSILKITDFQGNVVFEYTPPQGEQVIRREHAYLITSILSDNEARSWMFGRNSALNLSFAVAAKTGTTNDFRDNWTMGYTPDLVTGVWVGNADYTPMTNTTGTSGAAPIWSQFMESAAPTWAAERHRHSSVPWNMVQGHLQPSGTEPPQWCRGERAEIFRCGPRSAAGQPGPAPRGAAGYMDGAGILKCLRRGHGEDRRNQRQGRMGAGVVRHARGARLAAGERL